MSLSREECEHMGGEWVTSYHREDGTYVKPFCRKIHTRKDINGNKRNMWRREKGKLFDMTEYNIVAGDIEGVIKKDQRNGNIKWWVSIDGDRIASGNGSNMYEAKAKVEREMEK